MQATQRRAAGAAAALALMLVAAAAPTARAQFGFGSNYGSSYTNSAARPSTNAFRPPTGYPTYRPAAGAALPTMPVRTSAPTSGAARPATTSSSMYNRPAAFGMGGGRTRPTSMALPFGGARA